MSPANLLGLIDAVLAVAIGALATRIFLLIKDRVRVIGQRALLSGFEESTLFVLPERPAARGMSILPMTETEDFLAVNNLISTFINAGMKPPEKIKTTRHVTSDDLETKNLILICSSKSNDFTKEALERISRHYGDLLIPNFLETDEKDLKNRPKLTIEVAGGKYPSPSYAQQAAHHRAKELGEDPSEDVPLKGPLDDIALIVKAKNPWSADKKVLIVAGVRGIGTWGAAEFLKKWWRHLYKRMNLSPFSPRMKKIDFAVVLRVRYEDYDIKGAHIVHTSNLEPTERAAEGDD